MELICIVSAYPPLCHLTNYCKKIRLRVRDLTVPPCSRVVCMYMYFLFPVLSLVCSYGDESCCRYNTSVLDKKFRKWAFLCDLWYPCFSRNEISGAVYFEQMVNKTH